MRGGGGKVKRQKSFFFALVEFFFFLLPCFLQPVQDPLQIFFKNFPKSPNVRRNLETQIFSLTLHPRKMEQTRFKLFSSPEFFSYTLDIRLKAHLTQIDPWRTHICTSYIKYTYKRVIFSTHETGKNTQVVHNFIIQKGKTWNASSCFK